MALAGLAACGPVGPRPSGPSASGAEGDLRSVKPTRFEFWGDPQNDERKDQIAAWNAKYPNIQIELGAVKTTGQGVEAVAKLTAAIAAGTPPAAVDFDRFQVATFANRRVFQPLDDFVKRDKYDLKRFVPAVLEEAMGFDKKLYGLPRSTDDRLLYWNKEAFQEVGLPPDKPPATWDEMKQYAMRLTKRGGPLGIERAGFHTEQGQSHFHLFAWQNGGSFQTPDGKKATLPLAANQTALGWMADLMKDLGGWDLLKSFRDTWGSGAQDAFLVGQVAMQYQTNNYVATIARYRPDMRFAVAQPPLRKAGDRPLTWSGGFSYIMTRDNKVPDLAWAFIKWLVSEEGWIAGMDGNLRRARATGGVYVPIMTGQPELDTRLLGRYKTTIPAIDEVPPLAIKLMQYTRFRELSIAATDLWDGIKAAQREAVSQQKTPRQALEDNNIKVQKALDDAWAAYR